MYRIYNRLRWTENTIDYLGNYLYKIGISLNSNETVKRKLIYNPILMTIILSIVLMRDLLSYLINDRAISLKLGDLSYNWKVKLTWNLTIVIAMTTVVLIKALFYSYYLKTIDPSKSDRNFTNKNSKLDKTTEMLLNSIMRIIEILTMLTFLLPLATLYYSCSIFELFVYGLPWAILLAISALYAFQTFLWQAIYYCLIAYKFKLLLQLENLNLIQLLNISGQSFKTIIEIKFNKIFRSINKIHVNIKISNKFWSKWLLFQFLFLCLFCAPFLTQLFFGEKQILITCMFSLITPLLLCYLLIINLFSQFVYNEANKTYKILTKLIHFNKNIKFYIRFYLKVKINF